MEDEEVVAASEMVGQEGAYLSTVIFGGGGVVGEAGGGVS
jgi:hypothetical protein